MTTISEKVSFRDTQIESYIKEGNQLTFKLLLQDNQKVKVIFSDVLGMNDSGAFHINDIAKLDAKSSFHKKCVMYHYTATEDDFNKYDEYIIFDSMDEIVFAVVAEEVKLEKY